MKLVYERHGCTKLRIILPTLTQIPLFVLVSLSLRAMSGWSGWFDVGMWASLEPLFRIEGFGAIQDLTQPDASFILPVMIGLIGITNIEASTLSVTTSTDNKTVDCCEKVRDNVLRTSCRNPYSKNHENIIDRSLCSHDPHRDAGASGTIKAAMI